MFTVHDHNLFSVCLQYEFYLFFVEKKRKAKLSGELIVLGFHLEVLILIL